MLPEEITRLVGQTGDVAVMEVEKGAIKRFARATGDLNPMYLDDEYARNSAYGTIIAPPGFFGWPTRWSENMLSIPEIADTLLAALKKAGYARVLDGGIDYEFFLPVRAGDILAALTKIVRISERETKGGNLVFSIVDITYTNQSGDLVAKVRRTFICR